MSAKKRGLGRNNLEALLSDTLGNANEATSVASGQISSEMVKWVAVTDLSPNPDQPRHNVADSNLESLCASIQQKGILQPLLVRPGQSTPYEIIAGERRFQAAKRAGLTTVPVMIKEVAQADAMVIALVENIQRENLNPIEEALALKKLMTEANLTQSQVADLVGKSRPSVSNIIRLLGLHETVKQLLEKGDLELGHAKVLLVLKEDEQVRAAEKIVAEGLSVRATEKLVLELNHPSEKKFKPIKPSSSSEQTSDPDIVRLENSVAEVLGAVVSIHHASAGKGKVIIKYNSLAELEGILEHIQ